MTHDAAVKSKKTSGEQESLISPEDIADVAAFLCSDQARMICGQFIVVDGGFEVVA